MDVRNAMRAQGEAALIRSFVCWRRPGVLERLHSPWYLLCLVRVKPAASSVCRVVRLEQVEVELRRGSG